MTTFTLSLCMASTSTVGQSRSPAASGNIAILAELYGIAENDLLLFNRHSRTRLSNDFLARFRRSF